MKIMSETKVTVVGKAEPGLGQDGKTYFYKLAFLQNGQATNISTTQEVYDAIPEGMVDVILSTSFDDKYGSFKAVGLVSILTVNGRPFEKSAPAPADGGKK